jgi:hypothetical protein
MISDYVQNLCLCSWNAAVHRRHLTSVSQHYLYSRVYMKQVDIGKTGDFTLIQGRNVQNECDIGLLFGSFWGVTYVFRLQKA